MTHDQKSNSINAAAVLVALAALVPGVMAEIEPANATVGQNQNRLIERGRELFMNETFDGNGRTCASCHPPTNNFTIDPAFISTLPDDDPLFVAEFNPDLTELEEPELMRRFGLILENADGFDRPGVFRGVPHTLGLPTSIAVDPSGSANLTRADGTTVVNATGWSGDGAPGDGSLREFAIGAVIQHFPKTLNRVPGEDFRLPTPAELDALEAFQLSLGRQEELDLTTMVFAEPDIEAGKDLFNGIGINRACSACHNNAGANNADGFNGNFGTNVARLSNTPARRFDSAIPGDGGFDAGPEFEVPGLGALFFGNGSMNSASLVEAADTPPFFHNNSAATIEQAVNFYRTSIFSSDNPFQLSGIQAIQIAAFLRVTNGLENVRSAGVLASDARQQRAERARETIEVLIADTEDAIEVLTQGPLAPLHPDAVADLQDVVSLAEDARDADRPARNASLRQVSDLLEGIPGLLLRSEEEPEVAGDDAEGDGDDDQPPVDQADGDGDGDRQPADNAEGDGDGDRQPADNAESDGDGDQPPVDQAEGDGDGDRQPADNAEGDGDGDQPPVDQADGDGDGDRQPADNVEGDGDGDRQPADNVEGDGDGDQPPADNAEGGGDGDRQPADNAEGDGDGDQPPVDQAEGDGDGDRKRADNAEGHGDRRGRKDEREIAAAQ